MNCIHLLHLQRCMWIFHCSKLCWKSSSASFCRFPIHSDQKPLARQFGKNPWLILPQLLPSSVLFFHEVHHKPQNRKIVYIDIKKYIKRTQSGKHSKKKKKKISLYLLVKLLLCVLKRLKPFKNNCTRKTCIAMHFSS